MVMIFIILHLAFWVFMAWLAFQVWSFFED